MTQKVSRTPFLIQPTPRPFDMTRTLLPLLLVAVFLSGCAASVNPISGRRAFNYAWSPSEEIQVGREADPQIIAQYGLYDDPEVAAYVDSLGQALVRLSHVRRERTDPAFASMPFHFRVLDSPVVNAFALPGGYIYVTRGLLAHLEMKRSWPWFWGMKSVMSLDDTDPRPCGGSNSGREPCCSERFEGKPFLAGMLLRTF